MIRLITNSFLLLTVLSFNNYSQVKITFNIHGAVQIDEGTYLDWIGSIYPIDNENAIVDTVRKRIAKGLMQYGFYHFAIDSINYAEPDTATINFTVFLDEGKPTAIDAVLIEGIEGSDSVFAASIFDDLSGEIFTSQIIEKGIDKILTHFENNGFPFAEVNINSVVWNENSEDPNVTIYIEVKKGLKSKIDIVEIIGNENTDDGVIIREARLPIGSLYSQKIIDRIPERLNRLKFFAPVEKPVFYINADDKGVLQIKIKEKETNNFDGIIGYVPAQNDNESGYFTGYINISLRNLFGTGRSFAVRWQTEDRYSQEFELKYLEPWLFSYPFNLNLGLKQRKQDTTYVKRSFEGQLDYLANESITTSLVLGTGETIATENKSAVKSVLSSSFVDFGFNLTIDTRDDPFAPRRGFFFDNIYKFIRKKFEAVNTGGSGESNLQKFGVDLSYFYELFDKQIIAVALHGKELRGDLIDDGDLFLFGGTKTIRGYREKQFTANRLLWSNLEYRILISQRSYAFLFHDWGYYLKNESLLFNHPKTEGVLQGYGFGISLETGLGVLAVSYAIGKGNSLTEGLIHFGIINEF